MAEVEKSVGELTTIVTSLVRDAEKYREQNEKARTEATEYFDGTMKDLPHEVGHSSVVSRDVRANIKKVLPSIIRTILGNDKVVEYEPIDEDGEEAASDATDYINYVVFPESNGYEAVQDALHDGLKLRNGIIRWYRDKKINVSVSEHTRAEGQGAGNRAHYLSQVKREVDRALENASPAYRTANDTFRTRSQVIDAVDEGKAAKSGRVRAEDSIDQFRGMTPDQQQAFRSGYVDPIIADIESGAMGPATNRARSLTTPKYEAEFQAFAAPGRAQQLGQRIGRENRMFETNAAALGNSRTADNLGDIDDMANFDPAVLANLLTGNFKQAALTGARQAFNAGKGLPPRVVERVGRQMLETNPDAALQSLQRVRGQQVSRDQLRAMILASMLQNANAGVARLP